MTEIATTTTTNDRVLVLDKLEGMFSQEESDGYKILAFLDYDDDHGTDQYPPYLTPPPVDTTARTAIAKWCYKIASIFKYKSETAEIAMSCLDRFVCSPCGQHCLINRHQYRLAALTSMYTTSKVHEATALSIAFVMKLSSNSDGQGFTRKQIEAMEMQILMSLQFLINPITTMEYLCSYLKLVPKHTLVGMDQTTRQVLMELCQYQ